MTEPVDVGIIHHGLRVRCDWQWGTYVPRLVEIHHCKLDAPHDEHRCACGVTSEVFR